MKNPNSGIEIQRDCMQIRDSDETVAHTTNMIVPFFPKSAIDKGRLVSYKGWSTFSNFKSSALPMFILGK